MKKLIAGNWKMNCLSDDAHALIQDITTALSNSPEILDDCDILVCPPSVHIQAVKNIAHGKGVDVGAQDVSEHNSGAYTGNISASMIKDLGGEYVILGHSERREYHAESDALVAAKAKEAHEKGLITIICVGEKEEERDAGTQNDVVEAQLKGSIPKNARRENTVIAYEPVWAIGTGKTATPADVKDMHAFIRGQLEGLVETPEKVRILYGGSMKPANAKELLATPNVDGGLIGGASLKADDFIGIAKLA